MKDILEDLWLSRNPEYLKIKQYVYQLKRDNKKYYDAWGFLVFYISDYNINLIRGSYIYYKNDEFDYYLLKVLKLNSKYTINRIVDKNIINGR